MTDVDRIVGMLASDAVEKRIAAAIVLGEIRAKGAGVSEALAKTLDSGIALLERHSRAWGRRKRCRASCRSSRRERKTCAAPPSRRW
jgi:hypothetical protein